MQLAVNHKGLARFRRKALDRFPREYIEVLLGKATPERIAIERFVPFPHQANHRKEIFYDEQEIEKIRTLAVEQGLDYLGTIHSHPCAEGYPSETDNETARLDKDLIIGILQIQQTEKRKRSHVKWWNPQTLVEDISFL